MFHKDIDMSSDPFNLGMSLPIGQLTLEDEKLLRYYSKDKNLVVEFGTYQGRSSILMSYFAKQVVTIDPFSDNGLNKSDVYNRLKYFNNIIPICLLAEDTCDSFKDDSIDMLFHDGTHSKKGVLKDYFMYKKKLKKDCIIIFHDYKLMDGSQNDRMDVQGAVHHLLDLGEISELEIKGWSFVGRMPNE